MSLLCFIVLSCGRIGFEGHANDSDIVDISSETIPSNTDDNTDVDTDSDTVNPTDWDTETDADTVTGSKEVTDTNTVADADTDSVSDADSDSVSDADSDTVTGIDTSADADTDSDSDIAQVTGQLDETFANNGTFLHPSALGNDYARDALVSSDGAIFVTGFVSNGTNSDLVLMKLTPEGTLDMTFNGTGYIIRDNIAGGNGSDAGSTILFAPDGDLLISGTSDGVSAKEGVLWKVSTSGVSDSMFGASGTFTLNEGDDISVFNAKYDNATGNIFIAGQSYIGTDFYTAAWRVLADGSALDPGFNHPARGIIYSGGRGYSNIPETVSNGTMVVAGICNSGGIQDDGCSWLLDTDGNIVSAYGAPLAHGELAGGSNNDYWSSVNAYPGNRLILGGSSDNVLNVQEAVIARINMVDGSFDTSFGGGDGYWNEDVLGLGKLARVQDTLVTADGSIIAALELLGADDQFDVAVLRLDANGIRDMSFGSNEGILVIGDAYTERHPKMAQQPDGKILILTGKEDAAGDVNIVVWRIL
ncbi:MAG: hypothetical protein JXR76_08350 [Deltaproteobacteria bacterium]|nr:hypothetical protein [Deltaproteobacteria bacterium]